MIRALLAGLACILVAANTASAGIVSSTNTIIFPTPPANVNEGVSEDDTNAQAFLETQGDLSGGITLDITTSGTFGFNGTDSAVSGSLPAGTPYQSFYFYTDPIGQSDEQFYTGSATFEFPILGLIVLSDTLEDTDSIVGNPGTSYPTGVGLRGLELTGRDTISLDLGTNTVSWDFFRTVNVVDSFRVITAVPEPSTIAMGLTGLTLVGGFMVRRRRRA